ncbi:MAG: DinB family protein [Bacteroidia bacterium]|nr:DinB family protein [Bacteroidia bacterium]NND11591.1 DUF1572 domain-containing protein [Flavobacteriaceae bacterium]MBT8310350.1 DinB family protein [Bacteroidia bacterium]NNK29135.1 DUF1572 domain-containing protein [Flavobacteriaceae bacterium]NNL61150.1 DUF1572 domain-containing protein [Flavobacteriaceae bacterium]
MENAQQLASRVREVLLDGTWIANTNYKDQIFHVSFEEAAHKVASLNTIALLTFHINYYVAGVLNVFENGILDIRDKYSFDMPPLNNSEDWDKLRNTLISNSKKLAIHIEAMTEAQLNANFVDQKYGNYRRNIEGLIEHSYYHLGQISLIKKLIRDK